MNIYTFQWARRTLLFVLLILGGSFQGVKFAQAAAFSVNSLADTNDGVCDASNCTLREAINAANSSHGADTIQFNVSGTITVHPYLPGILSSGGSLLIDGAGHDIHIRSAGTDRIFFVEPGANLTLQDLELREGYMNSGGAIYNRGTLTITNGLFTENHARDFGGAIYNDGTLALINTTFVDNSVDVQDGGAIYIYSGDVTISGGNFQGNIATYSGGAIYNRYEGEYRGGDLTIAGTSFFSNRAFAGSGGAIANESDLEINYAVFGFNSAEDNGGALYSHRGGNFHVSHSSFGFNSADFQHGGAIYADCVSCTSAVKDSRIEYNLANLDGGGFYVYQGTAVFERTRIFNNTAKRDGGGGFNRDGMVYIFNDTLEENRATHNGGGFYNGQRMHVEDSTFEGNSADENGGGIYHAVDAANAGITSSTFYGNSANQGGGLFMLGASIITNCTISANRAPDGGGGIYATALTYLYNTILADSPSGGNCGSASLPPSNAGNNIDSGTTCHFLSEKGSRSNTNPLLGSLEDHGGPTETMLLQAGSPAINAVIYSAPNECPEYDQRGLSRPFGIYCDIGAVEQYYRAALPLTFRN